MSTGKDSEPTMEILPLARRLSDYGPAEEAVVTLTLDVSESGRRLPASSMRFLEDRMAPGRLAAGGPTAMRDALRDIAEQAAAYIRSSLRPETNGLFLAAGREIWEPVELQATLRNFLWIGRSAYVAPLVEAEALYPRVYAIRADSRSSEVFESHLGTWRPVHRSRAGVPEPQVERVLSGRSPRAGPATAGAVGRGWRERLKAAVRDSTERMLRETARRINRLHAVAPACAVVAMGEPDLLPALRASLAPELARRFLCAGGWVREDGEIRKRTGKAVRAHVQEENERNVRIFREHYAQGHRVALGPDEVLARMRADAMKRIFIDAFNPVPGSTCRSCGEINVDPHNWSFCADRIAPASLTQEVVKWWLSQGTPDLTFVTSPAPWLQSAGGMAGLLRD